MAIVLSRRRFLYGVGIASSALMAGWFGTRRQGATGVIGSVQSTSSYGIAGARVTLFSEDLSYFREVRTNSRGEYTVGDVAPGSYRLGVSAAGLEYQETEIRIRNVQRASFQLSSAREQGRWEVIGDTTPETFGGTNSGVLMPDGRIIFCHDTQDPVVFDPISGRKTFPKQPSDLAHSPSSQQGCHNVTHLLDGRILYVGGGTLDDRGNFSAGRSAIQVVKAFDPKTETWELQSPLGEARWYPGLVRLQDGDLLAFGGGQQPHRLRTETCEIFDRATRSWRPTGSLAAEGGFGPAALLYTGEVFLSWYPPQLYNPASGRWRNTANFLQPLRGSGEKAGQSVVGSGAAPKTGDHPDHSIAMLPGGRVVAIGIWGAAMGNPGSMVEIFDPAAERWSLGSNPATIRAFPEVLPLPDKRIFVAAGAPQAGAAVFVNEWGYTNAVDLYDPMTDSWRVMAPMKNAREYHAITLLLPDGRVLVQAGTGQPSLNPPLSVSQEIEVFSPPYLFRGPRPQINAISNTDLKRGESVSLDIAFTSQVTSVRIIGMNAITHFLDAGVPRLLDLPFSQQGSQVVVQIPTDPVRVMAGYYLLFALVDDIPSNGTIVRVLPN